MRNLAVAMAALTPALLLAAPYKVGILDVGLTGGDGASANGFVKVFDDLPDYQAEAIAGLDAGTLLLQDIIILYDMHRPGKVTDKWLENLERFAQAGGSIMSIYHQHWFRSIGPGVLKVGVRQVRPAGESALTQGIVQFETDWKDHIILQPGEDATVFLENTRGQPVAAFGPFGQGKVISCGLALGIRSDWKSSQAPTGMERKLLQNMLLWLQPRERWTARITRYTTEADISVWADGVTARQPLPVSMLVQGTVPAGVGEGTLAFTITDAGGQAREGSITLKPQPVARAPVARVRTRVNIGTEGLASGPGKVVYALQIGAVGREDEVAVDLVRATPPAEEFRAFWTHAFEDRLPVDVMPRIKACGFNAVIPRISGGTGAFYLSKVLPDIKNILGEEDWLANCIHHAHANGLQVHPYRNCFIMEGRATEETIAAFRADGRLQVSPGGGPIRWMCPSQQVNRQVEVDAACELVRDYDVDGFQFDFIRYPNQDGCYCPRCREKFEKQLGEPVANWPADVVAGGELLERYTAFRQSQITETVKLVSEAIRKIKPEVKISAAVFRDYARDSVGVGQDWVTWAQEGYVDFLCPMDYTTDNEMLNALVRDQIARVGEYVPVCAGLGLRASRSAMQTPEDMALQIDIARQAGAKGFVLFAWYPGCDEKVVLPQREDCLAGEPPVPWD